MLGPCPEARVSLRESLRVPPKRPIAAIIKVELRAFTACVARSIKREHRMLIWHDIVIGSMPRKYWWSCGAKVKSGRKPLAQVDVMS